MAPQHTSNAHCVLSPRNQSGQGLVEYVLIVALVSLLALGATSALGPRIAGAYSEVTCSVQEGGDVPVTCPSGASDPAALPPASVVQPQEEQEDEQGHAYIRFTRDSVTVGRTEKPRLTVEYGNDGEQPLEDVEIVCVMASGSGHFVATVQDGLFGSSHKTGDELTYSGMASALAAGQSSSVAFTVNPNRGNIAVRCTLSADDLSPVSDVIQVVVV